MELKKRLRPPRLATVSTSEAKAHAEDELSRVQDALAIAEEAMRRAEAALLEVERTSFLLEIGAAKDEVSSL